MKWVICIQGNVNTNWHQYITKAATLSNMAAAVSLVAITLI